MEFDYSNYDGGAAMLKTLEQELSRGFGGGLSAQMKQFVAQKQNVEKIEEKKEEVHEKKEEVEVDPIMKAAVETLEIKWEEPKKKGPKVKQDRDFREKQKEEQKHS